MEELDKEEQEEYLKVLKDLDENAQVEDVQKHEGWKIFDKAWKQVAEASKRKLASINPEDKINIIKLQMYVNFYENVIPKTIDSVKKAAKHSYEFADDKGWLTELGSFLTQRKF